MDWYHSRKIVYPVVCASSWASIPAHCWRQHGARGTLRKDLLCLLMVGLAPQWSPSCPSLLNHRADQNTGYYWVWKMLLCITIGFLLGRNNTIARLDINLHFSTQWVVHFLVCIQGHFTWLKPYIWITWAEADQVQQKKLGFFKESCSQCFDIVCIAFI